MRSAGRSASPTVPQAAEPTQLRASAWRSDTWPAGLPWRLTGHRAAGGLCVDRCLERAFRVVARRAGTGRKELSSWAFVYRSCPLLTGCC
jgi:hypothetical protein